MSEAKRSPFGTVLRTYRLQRGLSQAGLADRISKRAHTDPELTALGSVSDRTIANLEARRATPSKFARPRPHTVRILANGLDIAPGRPEELAFLNAAEETRQRALARPLPTAVVDTRVFVREGREEQFQLLRNAWALARTGQPQFTLIAGEAGSGKTHIIRELCLQAQIEDPSVRIAWGECTGGAASVSPYLPFLQGMNHLLGFTNREHELSTANANNLTRQAASIDTLLSVAPALIGTLVDEASLSSAVDRIADGQHELRDRLNQVLGVRNATATSGRLDQLVSFLSATSAASPVILVLEDLHWAGDLTSVLLLHLQRQLTLRHGVPILIIGSYRPSDLAADSASTRHPLESTINEIGRQVDNVVIDLKSSIGSDPGRAFIAGLLQRLSIVSSDKQDLAEFLFNRTEGHPLFAVELIRWLRDTGGMDRDIDRLWHLRPSANQQTAPGKILAVIAERIDRLPSEVRRILEVASVQGTTVTVDVLAGIQQLTDAELDDAIDVQLVARYRLLEPLSPFQVGNSRFHRYQFRHAMFQEYVYESLSLRERERLHGLTAELTSSLLGEAPHIRSGEIAFHFRQAHRYRDAARHAYAAASYALVQLDYDLARHWLDLTEEYGREANDRWHILAAQNGHASVLRGLSDLDRSIQLAMNIVVNARQDGFSDLEAESEDLLGQAYFDKGAQCRDPPSDASRRPPSRA